MTMRTKLITYLESVSALTALLGASPNTRLYWLQLPEQVSYPAARYFVVARQPTTAHDGPSGIEIHLVQFDILATDDGDAESVAEAIKVALDGVKDSTLTSKMVDESDEFEEADDLWRVSQEYRITTKTI